jgi:hypothetical protein
MLMCTVSGVRAVNPFKKVFHKNYAKILVMHNKVKDKKYYAVNTSLQTHDIYI